MCYYYVLVARRVASLPQIISVEWVVYGHLVREHYIFIVLLVVDRNYSLQAVVSCKGHTIYEYQYDTLNNACSYY